MNNAAPLFSDDDSDPDKPAKDVTQPAPAVRAHQSRGSIETGVSVWLCAPGVDDDDPDIPRWASAVIAEYSRPGRRIEVRAAAIYPGLPGDAAAVLSAAATSGRDALAVLPSPAVVARTRALLPAFTSPTTSHHRQPPNLPDPRRPRVLADPEDSSSGEPPTLTVVLAGPVRPAAASVPLNPARRAATSSAMSRWVEALAGGGVLVVLCPPQLSAEPTREPARWVNLARATGLTYTQHVVLVHVPPRENTLAPPSKQTEYATPFHPVHTDAFVFTKPGPPPHSERPPTASTPQPERSPGSAARDSNAWISRAGAEVDGE